MVDQGMSRSRKSSKTETSDIEMESETNTSDEESVLSCDTSPVIQSNGGGKSPEISSQMSPEVSRKSPKLHRSTLRNGKRLRKSSPVNGKLNKSSNSIEEIDLDVSIHSVSGAKLKMDDVDSASLDSLSRSQNPQQLLGHIEDALKDDDVSHALERICRERSDSIVAHTCSILTDAQAVGIYLLLLKNNAICTLFGTTKWIRHLLAEKQEAILKDKLAAQESRPLESLVSRRHRIMELTCQLRGKMTLIMANHKRVSSVSEEAAVEEAK